MLGDKLLFQYRLGGKVENFIALMNVEGAGMKHATWRNWSNYFLVLFI